MRAILRRDFTGVAKRRAFFVARAAVVGVPLLMAAVIAGSFERAAAGGDWIGQAIFGTTSWSLAACLLIVVPALLGDALSSEAAQNRLDVLRAAPLTAFGIVLGKWVSRLGLLLCMTAAATPVMASAVVFGGVQPIQVMAALAVILATLAWTSAVALYAGGTTPSLSKALARAYRAVLGIVLVAWLGPLGVEIACRPLIDPGVAMALGFVRALNPFRGLAFMNAYGLAGTGSWIVRATLPGLALAAIALVLAAGRVRRHGHPAGRTARADAAAAVPAGAPAFPAPADGDAPARPRPLPWRAELLWKHPAVWLEHRRARAGRRRVAPFVLGAILVLVIEGVFAAMTSAVRFGPKGPLHLFPLLTWFFMALLGAALAGAAAFQRDQEANTRDVLYATPLTSRAIAAAKVLITLRAGQVAFLFAVGHGLFAALMGHIPVWSVFLYLLVAALLVAAAGVFGLHVSLRSRSGVRAAVRTMVIMAAFLVLVPVVITFCLAGGSSGEEAIFLLLGWHPFFLAALPLHIGMEPDALRDMDGSGFCLVYVVLYAVFVIASVNHVIPRRLHQAREGAPEPVPAPAGTAALPLPRPRHPHPGPG